MDIRKFFSPTPAASTQSTSEKKTNEHVAGKIDQFKGSSGNTMAKAVQKSTNQHKKLPAETKTISNKKNSVEADSEDPLVIDDTSDDEIINDSQDADAIKKDVKGQNNKAGSTNKNNTKQMQSKVLKIKSSKQLSELCDSKRKRTLESETAVEIESFSSSGSSSTQIVASGEKKSRRNVSKKPDKEKLTEQKPVNQSTRKAKSDTVRKPKQVSSDEEDVELRESDVSEEKFFSGRKKQGRTSKNVKRSSRIFDSDSDQEEPITNEKPKAKRKKREAKVYVDDSDNEKNKTSLDKFVLREAKTDVVDNVVGKTKTTNMKVVIASDFFGNEIISRSDRSMATTKRKHEDLEKVVDVDVLFDEELHDDEDFMKTLDQLDGKNVKKLKPFNTDKSKETHQEVKPFNTDKSKETHQEVKPVSLASKLGAKLKQEVCLEIKEENYNMDSFGNDIESKFGHKLCTARQQETPNESETTVVTRIKTDQNTPLKKTTTNEKAKKTTAHQKQTPQKQSPFKQTPQKPSPMKQTPQKQSPLKQTPQKQSPLKQTPQKTPISAKKGTPSDKDGFGSTKLAGFQAFKQRAGPQGLGSKEIPEGAENCLEGLTFVITGVLDSIERDDAKSLIEKHGGKVTGNVSGKTSYLVIGREPGDSKIAKATKMKIKQLDEDALFDLIRSLPGKVSKYEIQAKEQFKKEKAKKELQDKQISKKLESFCSLKDVKQKDLINNSSDCSFTQIKNSSECRSLDSLPTAVSNYQSPLQLSTSTKTPVTSNQSECLLWVDKHKPTSLKNIIGQQGEKSNANKLFHWLKNWHENIIVKRLKPSGSVFSKGDGAGNRAALLSGPPGIGKTTTATLVCQEAKFSFLELNASDCRSKKSLKEVVSESLNNQTLVDYIGEGKRSAGPSGQFHCIIMDEVDGMAGNEDRGGLQELVQLIKNTKIPIICICNDRNSIKMRTLSNYCLDLRFQRPRVEQIKGAMMSLAFKEGLKIPPAALNEIIAASNHDIRQIIHNMSMWSASDKTLSYEQVKTDAAKAQKDIKLGPFDVCRKVFVNDEETRKMTFNDKSDLFFHDYSFGPLFVHENYPNIIPMAAVNHPGKHLSCLARTMDSICDGDLVDELVRKNGNWNLLPVQAIFASVIPGEIMRGSFPQMAAFPQWLGKFSSTNKTNRILQELATHMRLVTSCDKRGLALDYLPAIMNSLTTPLVTKGANGVAEVIKLMEDYDIVKEDFDNIMEVTKWPNATDPMSRIDSKAKSAFTRQYNKEAPITPYATGTLSKKKRGQAAYFDEDLKLEEEGDTSVVESEEDEDEEKLETDTMIKAKKPTSSKPSSSKNSSQQKKSTSGSRAKSKPKAGKKK